MKSLWIGLIILLILLTLWHLRGMRTSDVEQLKMETVKTYDSFAIMRIPPHIVAKTLTPGSVTDAPYTAFGRLAGYIFGNNRSTQDIAMTAPVTSQQAGESIAMTAPVTIQAETSGMIVTTFSMPAERSIDSLPLPNDAKVEIEEIPEKTVAVWQFGAYASSSRVERQWGKFQQALEEETIKRAATPTLAQYNDPRTPPRLRKNELRIKIDE